MPRESLGHHCTAMYVQESLMEKLWPRNIDYLREAPAPKCEPSLVASGLSHPLPTLSFLFKEQITDEETYTSCTFTHTHTHTHTHTQMHLHMASIVHTIGHEKKTTPLSSNPDNLHHSLLPPRAAENRPHYSNYQHHSYYHIFIHL